MIPQEMKTDLSDMAKSLPNLTEKQQAEMIGWLNGYVAGVEAQKSDNDGQQQAKPS